MPVLWIVGGLAVIYLLSGLRVIRPTQRGLVETFGKYKRFAEPGLNYVFTGIQRLTKIDITEYMVDAKPQQIITKDKVTYSPSKREEPLASLTELPAPSPQALIRLCPSLFL